MAVESFSFFLKTEKIPDSEIFFSNLEKYRLKYYYFQVESTYYLFLFGKTNSFEVLDLCYRSLPIIEELNTKQRKLRSLRGFILYALEILETAGDEKIQIFESNLPPFFWKRVKEVIRQNQKGLLSKFLFETSNSPIQDSSLSIEEVLQNLQNEVTFLKNEFKKIEERFQISNNS